MLYVWQRFLNLFIFQTTMLEEVPMSRFLNDNVNIHQAKTMKDWHYKFLTLTLLTISDVLESILPCLPKKKKKNWIKKKTDKQIKKLCFKSFIF